MPSLPFSQSLPSQEKIRGSKYEYASPQKEDWKESFAYGSNVVFGSTQPTLKLEPATQGKERVWELRVMIDILLRAHWDSLAFRL